MSASDPNSKIDLLDPPEDVQKKLKKAFCEIGKTEGNGVISFIEYVLLPVSRLAGDGTFNIDRKGEKVAYTTIDDIKKDYEADTIGPKELKEATITALNALLAPIRKMHDEDKEWLDIEAKAYPAEKAVTKKKKEKKIGTGYAGAKKKDGSDAVNPDGSKKEPGEHPTGESASEAMENLNLDKDTGKPKE